MKFIEWNSREVFVSTEGELWQKVILWPFGFISLLFFFRDGALEVWMTINAISLSSIFFILPELYLTTLFDIEANKVVKKANFLGVKFLKVEAPIDTSKIVIRAEKTKYSYVPSAFLEIQSGKRVRLGSFVTQEKARMFIKKIIKHVPIHYKFES